MRVTAGDVAREVVSAGVAPDCAAGCASRREARRPNDDARSMDTPRMDASLMDAPRMDAPRMDAPRRRHSGAWLQEVGGATTLLFDLASITKPMTAVAIALARIDRDTPLGSLLPEARRTPSERVTIEQLLAHRAGLERHRDLHGPLLKGRSVDRSGALREAALARRADAVGVPPKEGFPPVYSDLGYVLVGAALARAVAARDAGEAIARLVLEPLGVTHYAGTVRELAERGVRGPFAPTEDVPWRGGRVCGAVHDENAWALTELGGSGHAGIFATVDAVLAFGAAVLDTLHGFESALGDVDLAWLVRQREGGTLRAGFDGKSASGSSAGALFGARSFGHLGFTGTSLWLDPDAPTVVALLTNRVCPTRQHLAIRESRPVAHDALWARARQLVAHTSIATPPGAIQHGST
jgi:serine-type D-Ala-D-Ala carboxypeptidase